MPRIRFILPTPVLVTGLGAGMCVAAQQAIGFECPMLAATDLYCPACGATRAVMAIISGDISGALVDNAVLVLGVLALAVRALVVVGGGERRVERWDRGIGNAPVWLWVTGILVWTVLRNLPPMLGLLRPV